MKILAVDGGGIRGVLTTRILNRIINARPDFTSKLDFVSGTSVGSYIAVLLANNASCESIEKLLVDGSSFIFTNRDWIDAVVPYDHLFRANYTNTALKASLETEMGSETTLGDLKKRVLVPAFDLDNNDELTESNTLRSWKPKYMHNFDSPGNDKHLKAVDVCLRSSAAPTYFPTYQGFIDGGLIDNNPSMSALAKAIKETHNLDHVMLSIGTGIGSNFIEGEAHDWGIKQWLTNKRVLNILLDSTWSVPDYQARQLLRKSYLRFNVVLDKPIALDDASSIDYLLDLADKADISKLIDWLDNYWLS